MVGKRLEGNQVRVVKGVYPVATGSSQVYVPENGGDCRHDAEQFTSRFWL
jgi:hypothetical protein